MPVDKVSLMEICNHELHINANSHVTIGGVHVTHITYEMQGSLV